MNWVIWALHMSFELLSPPVKFPSTPGRPQLPFMRSALPRPLLQSLQQASVCLAVQSSFDRSSKPVVNKSLDSTSHCTVSISSRRNVQHCARSLDTKERVHNESRRIFTNESRYHRIDRRRSTRHLTTRSTTATTDPSATTAKNLQTVCSFHFTLCTF